MEDQYDSFLEIAVALMNKKKKPQTLESITKEVFSKKALKGNDMQVAQFQADFMLSGYFVCCGEDKNGQIVWDLKERQESSLLDKVGSNAYEMGEEDEEVLQNELKEDLSYAEGDINIDKYIEDDEANEQDEIEDELIPVDLEADETVNTDEVAVSEDEDEEKEEEEKDDIEGELEKRGQTFDD